MGPQRWPQRIATGGMHKVVGELRPGIHFNLWGSDSPKLASLALEVFVSGS
jgi:hypothetical protein